MPSPTFKPPYDEWLIFKLNLSLHFLSFPCCWYGPAECKVFKRLGLHSTFYTDEDMLQRYPLQPCQRKVRRWDVPYMPPDLPSGSSCALCGKNDKQEQMTYTECCNQVGG